MQTVSGQITAFIHVVDTYLRWQQSQRHPVYQRLPGSDVCGDKSADWEAWAFQVLELGRPLAPQLGEKDAVALHKLLRVIEVGGSGLRTLWADLRPRLEYFPYNFVSVDLQNDTIELRGVKDAVTHEQAEVVSRLVDANEGWVTNLKQYCPRPDRMIARLPKPMLDRIKSRKSGGGGYRLTQS